VIDTAARELSRTHTFILAGGEGERLHPLTASRRKPTVPFGGSFRIIDFTLSNCLKSGLARVAVLTQYRYKQIHRHVRQTWCYVFRRAVLLAALREICDSGLGFDFGHDTRICLAGTSFPQV
jgi:ADP-glucose pyrophosphorylase